MGGFLKKLVSRGGVLGAVTGLGMVSGGASALAGKLDPRLKVLGLEGLKYGVGDVSDDLGLGDKVIGPDAEAAILRNIMAKKAITQGKLMERFQKRASDEAVDKQIAAEKAQATRMSQGQQGDIERSMQQRMAQRGLGQSSIGVVGTEALKNQARSNLAGRLADIQSSKDDRMRGRLLDLSNVAGSTLADQNVPIQFGTTREEGFGKQLLKGAAMGLIGSASKGFGSRLAGA